MTERKNVKINISWVWSVLIGIIAIVLGWLESGQAVGGVVAFVIVALGLLACLVGLVPVIGPLVYYYLLWPAIVSWVSGFYPGVGLPLTLAVVCILTVLMSVVYTVVIGIVVLVVLAS